MRPSTLAWTDSHCHVHDERIPDGTTAAVAAAAEAGVTTLVSVGCDRATSLAAIAVAAAHDGVFATVGLHPHDAVNGVDTIVDLLDIDGIVAVGECGLDYYYDHSPREVQQRVFAEQIALANATRSPAGDPHPRRLGRHLRRARRRRRSELARSSTVSPAAPTRRAERSTSARCCRSPASSRSRERPRCRRPPPCVHWTGCWSRPTARTSRRCRTVASRTVRRGSRTSASTSPTCATSPLPRWLPQRRRTPARCSRSRLKRRRRPIAGPSAPDSAAVRVLRAPASRRRRATTLRGRRRPFDSLLSQPADTLTSPQRSGRQHRRRRRTRLSTTNTRWHSPTPTGAASLAVTVLTLLALPALWWANTSENNSTSPNLAVAGIDPGVDAATTRLRHGTRRRALDDVAPVFLEGPTSAAGRRAGRDRHPGQAADRRRHSPRRPSAAPSPTGTCIVAGITSGSRVTVVNLDNNRSVTCTTILAPGGALGDLVMNT